MKEHSFLGKDMETTYKLEVLTLSRFNPTTKGRQNAYVYPGEMYPPKSGLLPFQCLGAAVKFDMDRTTEGQPKIVAEVVLRNDMNFHKKYEGIHDFVRENQANLMVMVTKTGYFLMERESAKEIERLGMR